MYFAFLQTLKQGRLNGMFAPISLERPVLWINDLVLATSTDKPNKGSAAPARKSISGATSYHRILC
jgi:hypothetical protein